jgi:hypothetical protein
MKSTVLNLFKMGPAEQKALRQAKKYLSPTAIYLLTKLSVEFPEAQKAEEKESDYIGRLSDAIDRTWDNALNASSQTDDAENAVADLEMTTRDLYQVTREAEKLNKKSTKEKQKCKKDLGLILKFNTTGEIDTWFQ